MNVLYIYMYVCVCCMLVECLNLELSLFFTLKWFDACLYIFFLKPPIYRIHHCTHTKVNVTLAVHPFDFGTPLRFGYYS